MESFVIQDKRAVLYFKTDRVRLIQRQPQRFLEFLQYPRFMNSIFSILVSSTSGLVINKIIEVVLRE